MLKLIALTALISSLSTTEGAAQEWFSKPKQSLPPTAAQQYCSEVSRAGLVRYCGTAARVRSRNWGKRCSHHINGSLAGDSSVCLPSSWRSPASSTLMGWGTITNDPRSRPQRAGGSRCGGNCRGHDPGPWGTRGGIAPEVVAGSPVAAMTQIYAGAPRARRRHGAEEQVRPWSDAIPFGRLAS